MRHSFTIGPAYHQFPLPDMISGITPITPFTSSAESIDDTESIWALFSHTGVYVMVIGSLIQLDWRSFVATSSGVNLPD